jgi:acetyl esterase/lipase
VDYRKPPAVRFPAGLDDAVAAWRWALEQNPQGSVAVAGDSSGGNLAFALVVKLAQLGERQPVACVGISPWLRLDMDKSVANLYGRFCTDLYLGGGQKTTSAADPLVSPVNADSELVRRFPPILMHAGRNELTTEDVKEMASVCGRAGVPAEVEFYPAPHIFQVGPWFPESTRDSLSRIDTFLCRHWQQNPAAEL